MPHYDMLSIIDDDGGLALRSMSRRDADVEIRVKGGIRGFVDEMDDLLTKGFTFQRAVFTTHGNSGVIFFGGGAIRRDEIENVRLRGYDRLFPDRANTRILFAGTHSA